MTTLSLQMYQGKWQETTSVKHILHKMPVSKLLLLLLVVFFINVDLAIFQPYLDLEAGDNQSLKIQVARRGIEPRSSCSASQELNHSATAAPASLQVLYHIRQ